jgi:phospholipid/cholesterol/gamma-HCH transport system ATP-binding protein
MTVDKNTHQDLGSTKDIKPVVAVKHLYKSFGNNSVLIDFNFNLYRGENVVVLGKSGSGKSVLIKCIIGLMKPDKGYINVLDNEVPKLSSSELDKLRVKVGFFKVMHYMIQ